ncbi:MAG TPA: DUF1232 domain-containing protein [Clostridiaceae bacterium]
MKISNIKASISEVELLNIIKEYVEVEGLYIDKLEINSLIKVQGRYKFNFEIPFTAEIGIGNVHENKVSVQFFHVKIRKIGIGKVIQNIAIKAILKKFAKYGITMEGDFLEVDINSISKFIPYTYFTLVGVTLKEKHVEVTLEDLIYSQDKETFDFKEEEKIKFKYEIKAKDTYSKLRGEVEGKLPDKLKPLVEYLLLLPDIIALLFRLFRDKRVKFKNKLIIGGILAYFVSPIALIADFIPIIGEIDELAVAFLGLNTLINDIPEEIILDNWQGKENIIYSVKQATKYISKLVGGSNVNKVVSFITAKAAGRITAKVTDHIKEKKVEER